MAHSRRNSKAVYTIPDLLARYNKFQACFISVGTNGQKLCVQIQLHILDSDFCTAVGQLSEPKNHRQGCLMLIAHLLLNASPLSLVGHVASALYIRAKDQMKY